MKVLYDIVGYVQNIDAVRQLNSNQPNPCTILTLHMPKLTWPRQIPNAIAGLYDIEKSATEKYSHFFKPGIQPRVVVAQQ